MPVRSAEAEWKGDLMNGRGEMKMASGAYQGAYTFRSRMEEGPGTNPEELIAAAHAGCFSMALSAGLAGGGSTPTRVHTTAKVKFEKVEAGFAITGIHLDCEAEVPGMSDADFQAAAQKAKAGCPVSKALSAVPIELTAKLV